MLPTKDERSKLVQQLRCDQASVVEVEKVLAILEIGASLRKDESANTLIADCAVGIEAAKRNELRLPEQVAH